MSLPLVFQAGVRDEIDEAYAWYEDQRAGLGERVGPSATRHHSGNTCPGLYLTPPGVRCRSRRIQWSLNRTPWPVSTLGM
jgi:hypothetical protein